MTTLNSGSTQANGTICGNKLGSTNDVPDDAYESCQSIRGWHMTGHNKRAYRIRSRL